MVDKLVEIDPQHWTELRDLYKKDWLKNFVGYCTVNNYVKWFNNDPNVKHLTIYSLNDDWSDGTFLVVDRYQLLLNSINPSNERLAKALSLLDWSHGYKVSSFLDRHRPAVLDAVESKNLQKEYDSLTVLYFLPKEKAATIQIACPEGFTLKSLSEEDAKCIDDLWPNRHEGSLFFIKRLINWNPNIGIYTKNGELVAWCLRLQAGPLGALQVKDSHKRMGLGTLAVKAMMKILAEQNEDTFALVNDTNVPSRRLFEGLGFEVIDKCHWLRTYPLVPFSWKDD